MDTETMIRKLESLLEEYEISNDNAVCSLTFQSIEMVKNSMVGETKEYRWNGDRLKLVDNSDTLKVEDQFPNH